MYEILVQIYDTGVNGKMHLIVELSENAIYLTWVCFLVHLTSLC